MADLTLGELHLMLKRLEEKFDEKNTDIMSAFEKLQVISEKTLDQATKTNGRVNKHDWTFKVIWIGLSGLWVVLLIGVPFLWKVFTLWIEQRDLIKQQQFEVKIDKVAVDVISQIEDKYDLQVVGNK